MNYFIAIGGLLSMWTLLLVLSGERQRQLNELEIAQQVSEATEAEAERIKNTPARQKKK